MASPLEELSRPGTLPDGTPVRVLPHAAMDTVAARLGTSLREAQVEALRRDVIPERYLRNFKTLNREDQITLLESRVCLAGLGGLGGPLLDGLARLGFGCIRAADPDAVEPSNLNRQLLATEGSLGQSKALAARVRLFEVNPAVEAEVTALGVVPEEFERFFAGSDLALDALGGLACRPWAERGAREAGVPLITAAVAGWTVLVATVLPGDPGPADLFAPREGRAGPSAEDALGCLIPAIDVAVGLVLAEAVRLVLGRTPLFGGPGGAMAVLDLERMSLDRFDLRP